MIKRISVRFDLNEPSAEKAYEILTKRDKSLFVNYSQYIVYALLALESKEPKRMKGISEQEIKHIVKETINQVQAQEMMPEC